MSLWKMVLEPKKLREKLQRWNEPSDLHQHSFETVVSIPVGQNGQFRWIDFTIELVYKRQIHARDKLKSRWWIRIIVAASDFERVNTVLVHRLVIEIKSDELIVLNNCISHVLVQELCHSNGSSRYHPHPQDHTSMSHLQYPSLPFPILPIDENYVALSKL